MAARGWSARQLDEQAGVPSDCQEGVPDIDGSRGQVRKHCHERAAWCAGCDG